MKKTLVFVVIIALYVLVSVLFPVFTYIFVPENPYQTAQEDLAKKLNVNIEDHPYEMSFPVGYFFTILKPGMTMKEVHNIVQGYEKVLHCDTYSEIYYYFTSDDSSALRFEIRYDEQGRFKGLQGEDENSRTIWTEGCEEGLIDVK